MGLADSKAVPAPARKATIGLGSAFAVVLLLWCVAFVPADMDEFAPMHRLACLYPFSHLNTFREGCNAYLLDFGIFSYHRSFGYVGATSSVLYWPLWSLWKSPFSFYLLGVASLGLFALGLTKALRLDGRYALIPLGYFPVTYMWIHDTGPIRLAFLSLPALTLLARYAIGGHRRSRQIACGALAALMVTACVEDKPFYVLVAPIIGLCAVAMATMGQASGAAVRLRAAARQGATALATFVVVLTAGLALLLFAGHSGGGTYFSELRSVDTLLRGGILVQWKRLFEFTLLLPMYGHRMFGLDSALVRTSALSLVPTVWLVYSFWRKDEIDRRAVAWMGAAYAAGAAVFLVTRTSSAPHHYVFLQLPVVILLMLAASRTTAGWNRVLVYVMVSGVLAMVTLTARPVAAESARARDRFYAYLSRPDVASTHVVNFSSWGGYYQQALYGADAQLVTFVEPLTGSDATRLATLATSIARDVIDVCLDCTRPSIAAAFAGSDVKEIDLGLARWKLFEVRLSQTGVVRGERSPWDALQPRER